MLPIKEHLVIIRTGASLLNLKSYNCQELGLAKSLAKKGLKVSLVLAGENEKKIRYRDRWTYYIYLFCKIHLTKPSIRLVLQNRNVITKSTAYMYTNT